jgi:CRP-like cAMP-binding protein
MRALSSRSWWLTLTHGATLAREMELVSCWVLTQPYVAFEEGNVLSRGDAGRTALSAEAARVPWSISSRPNRLWLSVGPMALDPGVLEPALELYHCYRHSLALHLPPDGMRDPRCGFRMALSSGGFDVAGVRAVAERAACVVSPLLASLALPPLRLELDGPQLICTFGQALPPTMYDEVVPVFGAVLLPLLRAAAPTSVPRGLESSPSSISVRAEGVEILPRRDVAPARVAALWEDARETLERFVPRGTLDAARRALHVPSASRLPSPAPPTVPVADAPSGAGLLTIVPFRAGARPIDEVVERGTGASEAIGFLKSGADVPDEDGIWILFRLGAHALPVDDLQVKLWAAFLPPEGEAGAARPVPGLQGIDVPPRAVAATADFKPALTVSQYRLPSDDAYVAAIAPQAQLLPADASQNGGQDPFTFAAFFQQRFAVTLGVSNGSELLDQSTTLIEVFDTQRFGSLYERLLYLVAEDTARQAAVLGESDVYAAHHPFYPVLAIGINKAAFYVKAIHQDLAEQSKHLANPRWLLRVGLYLEYLTCIGLFEAVREEHEDLLSAEEREFYEKAAAFRQIRQRIDVARWKDVWRLRSIVAKGKSPIAAGSVGFLNLLRKQAATLAFLDAHHADLKHAVELAGPNLESSQESWHRVYRDAERAIVNSALAAFPELQHVPARYREFALWHVRGEFAEVAGVAGGLLPRWLTDAFGDQDGVYPAATRQYRASLNHVAAWARDAGLMDFAGSECVPRSVSLIEALLDEDDERFSALQARDGYAGALEAVSYTVDMYPRVSREMVSGFLRGLEIFAVLEDQEIEQLARQVKRISTVPTQDVVVQGQAGSSLFIVETGNLEVLKREPSGERPIGRLRAGSVFGELALLTGEPRSATVRAIDYGLLLEIEKPALQPILDRRPRIIDALSDLLAGRSQGARGSNRTSRASLVSRMSEYLLGGGRAEFRVAARARQPKELVKLLEGIKTFRPLKRPELERLAEAATVASYGRDEAIVVQGEKGSSVFVVDTGQVEVVLQKDGGEISVARLGRGGVFGEMALFTGERRTATVRAFDGPATVIEISRSDLLPVISRRPQLIIEVSELLASRQAETRTAKSAASSDERTLAKRVKSFLLA